MITAKIYELFLECFEYKFPDENKVISMFETKKLSELIEAVCPSRCSKSRQLILIQQTANDIKKDLETISEMKDRLVFPKIENEMPRIKFNLTFKVDDLVNMRRIKSILDEKAGFTDENGKSMYFNMPLTTVFYIYYKTISET